MQLHYQTHCENNKPNYWSSFGLSKISFGMSYWDLMIVISCSSDALGGTLKSLCSQIMVCKC